MKLNSEKQYTIRFKASDLKNILRCVCVCVGGELTEKGVALCTYKGRERPRGPVPQTCLLILR